MGIFRYDDYIIDNSLETLLESRLLYSEKLRKILTKMQDNKIASILLKLYTKDIETRYNYIDATKDKELVSFTPDRKAQEIIKSRPELWEVVRRKHLTDSDENDLIFAALGYDKTKIKSWKPEKGEIGIILRETISEETGRTYCLWSETKKLNPKVSVLNKEGLQLVVDMNDDKEIWKSTARTDIRIGRMVRAILENLKVEFTEKDIEEFTNLYKATFDFMADKLKQFDIINGDRIAYWYYYERYHRREGVLGNSCMSGKPADYFDLYTKNPEVCSLVILYDDEGKIDSKGKYTSAKIKGRALLWKVEVFPRGTKIDSSSKGKIVPFLDRIYTTQDADYQLFLALAKENNWLTKDRNVDTLKVQLNKSKFTRYPYVDTLCYLEPKLNIVSNYKVGHDTNRTLRSTDGDYGRA